MRVEGLTGYGRGQVATAPGGARAGMRWPRQGAAQARSRLARSRLARVARGEGGRPWGEGSARRRAFRGASA